MLQSRCQGNVDGTAVGVIPSDLREHLERIARQAGENSAQILYLNEYKMEIQNLKRRNSECALIESQRELESQRRQLQETNQGKLNVREYIRVAN